MSHIKIINISFAAYLSLVVVFSLSLPVSFLWGCILLIFVNYYLLCKFSNLFEKNKRLTVSKETKYKPIFLIFNALLCFSGQILYWLAYYPGGFNLDSYGQWDQVHGVLKLNNWHPVFTTFLYWIMTRIVDSLAFCIVIQLLIFSVAVTVLMNTLRKNGIEEKWLLLGTFFIAYNPAVGLNNVCLYKDVPFAICIVFSMNILLRIYFSNGAQINNFSNNVLLIIVSVMIMLIRHNGIFYVGAMFLTMLIFYNSYKKYIIKMAVCTFIILLFIEGPLFQHLEIEKHSNIVGESVGIPMEIMANSLVNDYNHISDDVKNFMLDIADLDDWKKYHITGEWDSCKWEFGGISLLNGEKLSNILLLSAKTIQMCPETSYEAFRESTRVVWQIIGKNKWNTRVYIEENEYGIKSKPVIICKRIVDYIIKMSNTVLGSFFSWNIGNNIVVLMFASVIMLSTGNSNFACMTIPTIIYDLFTMLLLCGPSHRYFYFNSIIIVPLVLIVLNSIKFKNKSDRCIKNN